MNSSLFCNYLMKDFLTPLVKNCNISKVEKESAIDQIAHITIKQLSIPHQNTITN